MACLKSVEELVFNSNSVDVNEQMVLAWKTMPALHSIMTSLSTEDQVDLLISHLPNLTQLNNLPVERDSSSEEETEQESDSPQLPSSPEMQQVPSLQEPSNTPAQVERTTSSKNLVQGVKNEELQNATMLHDRVIQVSRERELTVTQQ